MSYLKLDFAKMARDPKGNKLLKDTIRVAIEGWHPEYSEEEVDEKVDDIVGDPIEQDE